MVQIIASVDYSTMLSYSGINFGKSCLELRDCLICTGQCVEEVLYFDKSIYVL